MPAAAPQLELFRAAATDPNVAWLVELLFVNGSWLTAREVLQNIPPEAHDSVDFTIDDRRIRMWAEAAAPKIISGQHGYKHTDHATAEEIKAFINTMESQGTKMLARANKVRAYAHAKIG
jgi:predicted RNA-binding protein (virulence factor B family)